MSSIRDQNTIDILEFVIRAVLPGKWKTVADIPEQKQTELRLVFWADRNPLDLDEPMHDVLERL